MKTVILKPLEVFTSTLDSKLPLCACCFSERLKLSLTTETKAWCVAFGKACNEKYRTEMDEILEFIDDITKKLNRPIKDLDDIRLAMKALKDVRENEIRIDMAIGPIEVCFGGIRALFHSKVPMMSPVLG